MRKFFFILLLFLTFFCLAAKKTTKKSPKTMEFVGREWQTKDLKKCPAGWKMPSESAWNDLKKEIGKANSKTKKDFNWKLGTKPRCVKIIQKPSEKKNDIKYYKTIKIGNQTWMAENLNYSTGKSWCLDNDDYNCSVSGRLYDYNTALKACPKGWHLPTRREWSELPANKLSAPDGETWWAATEYGNGNVYSFNKRDSISTDFRENITDKTPGYSIRCVKNYLGKTGKANSIKGYKTVKIGNQTWMAENLNYSTGKSWCYENDDFYCKKSGRLYDYNTALKACPKGWHLPSDVEWTELQNAVGTDVSGKISASPGGWRNSKPESASWWQSFGEEGYFWSSTIFSFSGQVQLRKISLTEDISSVLKEKNDAFSVRCIQNPPTKVISKTFTDSRDQKKYGVIKIGELMWMKQNLNYEAKGSVCYENKKENCDKYGRFYDWETSLSVCPAPWRLSNLKDWQDMVDKVGKSSAKKLKAKSWKGTDNFGFSALAPGFTKAQGFAELGERGYWWTSDPAGMNASYTYISADNDEVVFRDNYRDFGYSVRCVMDCGLFNCVVK